MSDSSLNVLAVGLTAFLNAELKPVVHRAGVVEISLLSKIPLVGKALFDGQDLSKWKSQT
jgi:ABC-type uncharacterized transport system permease subunit